MSLRVSLELEGDRKFRQVVRSIRLPKAAPVHRRALSENARATRLRAQRVYLSGRPLKVRTGRLRRSMQIDPSGLPKHIDVGSDHPGAAALHFGRPGTRLRARPWLFPAVVDERPKFPDVWVREYERYIAAQGATA